MIGIDSVLQGRFRLDRQIGRGGFARVFLASDLTLHRQVAIKVLNPELLADTNEHDFLARFRQEARAVAALEHPNILGVYDYGEAEGVIYIVMPYVEGGTLFTHLAGGRALQLEEAAAYLRQAAAALDYAHRRGLVHRDIKPQNMLLRAEDNRLLLADFGIAKVLTSTSRQSQTGVIGTLAYMAPEQFEGRVGPGIDIYALGCVLFQMLTGQLPFSGSTEQMVLGHLSAAVPSVYEWSRGRVPLAVQPVIERALEKRPEDRFASAGELSAAFDAALGISGQLFATAQPRPPTPPLPPGTTQIPTNLPPVGPATGSPTFVPPTVVDTGRQDSGTIVSRPLTGPYDSSRQFSQPPGSYAPSAPYTPPNANTPPTPQTPQNSYTAPATGGTPPSIPYPAAPAAPRRSSRGLLFGLLAAVVFLLVIAGGVALRSLQGDTGRATPTATAGVAAQDNPTATAPVVANPSAGPASAVPSAAASAPPAPSPSPAASARPSPSPAAPPRSPLAGTTAVTFTGFTDHVRGVTWTADGKMMISGSDDGAVRFWQPDGKLLNTIAGRTFAVTSVALSPDGKTLAVGSDDHHVHLWRADGTPLAILTDHTENVEAVRWSPDGKTLASASSDGTVRLWTPAGQPIRTLKGHTNAVQDVAWSPDGQLLATASWDKTVRLWRLDGSPVATLNGHTDEVYAVAWSPDGKTIASGSRDGTVRLWTATGQPIRTLTGHTSFVSSLAWSPDGKTLASGSFDKTVRLWAADGTPLGALNGHTDAVTGLAWLPDGSGLASTSWDKTIRLWR